MPLTINSKDGFDKELVEEMMEVGYVHTRSNGPHGGTYHHHFVRSNEMSKELRKDGVYIGGQRWREFTIHPSKFKGLIPYIPMAKAAAKEYYKKHEAYFGDCYPSMTNDEWIWSIINTVRSHNQTWSDDYMAANPGKVAAEYELGR